MADYQVYFDNIDRVCSEKEYQKPLKKTGKICEQEKFRNIQLLKPRDVQVIAFKKMKKVFRIFVTVSLFAAITTCNNDKGDLVEYTVSFNSNGGSAVTSQIVKDGGKVTRPEDPTLGGHSFDAWYNDMAFNSEWNFNSDVVKEDMTLYAKWSKNAESVKHTGGPGIYVAGYIYEDDTQYAVLWKDGLVQYLGVGKAYSVFVSGNDVYVVGYVSRYDYISGDVMYGHRNVATLWKNGIAQNLTYL